MAGNILKRVVTFLGFEVDNKGLKNAEAGINGLTVAAEAFVAALAAVAAPAALLKIASHAAEAGELIAKASEKYGIGIKDFQQLAFAADLADVSVEELGVGLGKLSKKISEAKSGNKAAGEFFTKLGIDISKITTTSQGFTSVANALKKLPPGFEKAAAAQEAFGRGGLALIPLINEGIAEQAELVERVAYIYDKAGTERAKKFSDTLKILKRAFDGIVLAIGNALIPALQKAADYVIDFIAANKELIHGGLAEGVKGIAYVFEKLTYGLVRVGEYAAKIVKAVPGLKYFTAGVTFLAIALSGLLSIFAAVSAVVSGATAAIAFLGSATAAVVLPIVGWAMAIAAVLGALFLIVDDIVAFAQGRGSIMGLVIQFFEERFPNAFKFVTAGIDLIVEAFKFLGNIGIEVFDGILTIIKAVAAEIYAMIKGPLDSVNNYFSGLIDDISYVTGKALSWGANKLSGAATDLAFGNMQTAIASGHAPLGSGAFSGALAGQQSGAIINNNVVVNVPPGTDPVSATQTAEGFKSMLRETQRDVSTSQEN